MSEETTTALCVAVLGTCDTKLEELLYVRTHLLNTHHVRVKLIDVGRTPSTHPAIDITQPSVLAGTHYPTTSTSPTTSSSPLLRSPTTPPPDLSTLPRTDVISALSACAAPLLAALAAARAVHALIALGGSGGSTLAAGVFAALPLGFPKLLVSTMAAGNVEPYVAAADVALVYSVVDIAGLNDILCPVLANAAGAVAGMARAYQARLAEQPPGDASSDADASQRDGDLRARNKRIAITMFGVTTAAVTHARALLAQYACTPYVFHATGAGGRAMERLLSEGFFDGVLDLTTTELADDLVGGVLSAGPHRLEAAARRGVPQVVSLGALDMVNFGPKDTVPEQWRAAGRTLYEHNPSVTLMRTTKEECAKLGQLIAEKLKDTGACAETTEVWIPRGGTSALSVRGAPFDDREADEELFRAVSQGLSVTIEGGGHIRVVEREEDINAPSFVQGIVGSLVRMIPLDRVAPA